MSILRTPSDAALMRPSSLPAFDRGGGARTIPLVAPSLGASTFITGLTEFAPGVAIPFHCHNCEESVVLLEGEAVMDIDGQEHPLQVLDTTFIPPNVMHRFRNVSATMPMKILWIYANANATRTLRDTGQTNPVSLEHHKKA
jgi:quercetin dioxygenase-like cupin family protein